MEIAALFHMCHGNSKVLALKSGDTLKSLAVEPSFLCWAWENNILSFGV